MQLALFISEPMLHLFYWMGAIIFGFGTGYFFGQAIPSWESDEYLENPRGNSGGYYGYGSRRGCSVLVFGLTQNAMRGASWGLIVCGIGAVYCVVSLFQPADSSAADYASFFIVFSKPFWAAVLPAVAGYVISRVNDKGPVGPLE